MVFWLWDYLLNYKNIRILELFTFIYIIIVEVEQLPYFPYLLL